MSQDDAGGLGGRLSDGPNFGGGGGGQPPVDPKCDPDGDPGFNGGLFEPVDVLGHLAGAGGRRSATCSAVRGNCATYAMWLTCPLSHPSLGALWIPRTAAGAASAELTIERIRGI
jgi:hypothetical protein